jgi:hypothetical protein
MRRAAEVSRLISVTIEAQRTEGMIEMARKLCVDCGQRPYVSSDIELCAQCEDYAGWENTHTDHAHDRIDTFTLDNTIFNRRAKLDQYIAETKVEMTACPVCHPELDPRTPKRTGHTNTRAHSHNSHAGHGHPLTPRDRAACRKFMAAHNGMDQVTWRVAQREIEIDDAFDSDDVMLAIQTQGCMYHKDAGRCPSFPADRYYRVSGGDIWCGAGVDEFRAGGNAIKVHRINL